MSDHAKVILWLGFIMILFQVIKSWPEIKSVVFG